MGADAGRRFLLIERLGAYELQICAAADATPDEVVWWAQRHSSSTAPGARRWRLASPELDGWDLGDPNPALCVEHPDRRHWLLFS